MIAIPKQNPVSLGVLSQPIEDGHRNHPTTTNAERLVELALLLCSNGIRPGVEQNLRHLIAATREVHLGDALPTGTSMSDLVCFLLRERAGLNYQQISAGLGYPRNAVAAHIAHMRTALIAAIF